jgi:serine/threonine protein kinase
MADVFCAHDELLRRRVAVKVFATGQDVQRRAERETRILASLRHVNLITVLDAGIDATDPARPLRYLVMELIDGPTLAQQIAVGALDPAEVADLGAQLAIALNYVHDHDIVHRDIKPANILLAPHQSEGRLWTTKLTDFGIAHVPDTASLTMTGLTLGTANYVSPEQALGQAVRPSSDIYSLGLVLLEALTGERAFTGAAPNLALVRIDHQPQVPNQLGARSGCG